MPASPIRPDPNARPEYVAAFLEIADRIASSLSRLPRRVLPIRMSVAGGAALHLCTGERVSRDVDATFSRRIALPENLEVAYRDADGAARLLYFRLRDASSSVRLRSDNERRLPWAVTLATPLASWAQLSRRYGSSPMLKRAARSRGRNRPSTACSRYRLPSLGCGACPKRVRKLSQSYARPRRSRLTERKTLIILASPRGFEPLLPP